MSEKVEKKEEEKEDWMQQKWRPAMGWMYMMVCVFDFILFPILWAIVQFWETEAANDAFRQWHPLTLQGAGLFHIAMGAVLGVSAYGRTQEKVAGAAATPNGLGGLSIPGMNTNTPTPMSMQSPTLNTPTSAPRPMARPVVQQAVELDPYDPPTRNTRND